MPHPLGPRRLKNSPSATVRLMPFTTGVSSKCLVRRLRVTWAMGVYQNRTGVEDVMAIHGP